MTGSSGADSENQYCVADPRTRRQLNQTSFAKLLVYDDEIAEAELTDVYGALLRDELAANLETFARERRAKPQEDPKRLRAGVLSRTK